MHAVPIPLGVQPSLHASGDVAARVGERDGPMHRKAEEIGPQPSVRAHDPYRFSMIRVDAEVSEQQRGQHPRRRHPKAHDKKEYQREIRKLFRASDRLAQIKKRGDAKRHEIELKTWKVDSQIRLLAARLSMDRDNPKLHNQLHKLLVQKNGLQLKRCELDREKVKQRLKRLDTAIKKLKFDPDDRADRALQKILTSINKQKRGGRPRRKTAVTKKDGGLAPRNPSRDP